MVSVMSGGFLQGLPVLSHQGGFPSAPAVSSHCHSRRLHQRCGELDTRQQDMESLSGVVCSTQYRSSFGGNAEGLSPGRASYPKSKEVVALTCIKRPHPFLVLQTLDRSFLQSHQPRGTFPASGEQSKRTSNVALQDSAGLKLNGKPGDFISEQKFSEDCVPDQLISSEGSSHMFPSETIWREKVGHFPTSSSRASTPYRHWISRVKLNSASGEEAVLRGFEDGSQQASNKSRTSLSYGKTGSRIEPSYMIADQTRSSQNGAHPRPMNERSRLSSAKQVYGPVLRHVPNDGPRGTSSNSRMRDTDGFDGRIQKLAPDSQVRWEDRPAEMGALKHRNSGSFQTVKASGHSARTDAVLTGTSAGRAKWVAATKVLKANRSPAPATAEQTSLSPLHGTVELEPVGGSVENGGPSEAVKENTKQLAKVLESEATGDTPRQALRAVDDLQDISEPSISSHKERHGLNAKVFIVNNVQTAEAVVTKLRGEYRDLIHACDTEVAGIDVKKESPVGHGRLICLSIYCGPDADFGEDRCRLWVDVLGKPAVLGVFKSYFEDASIKKIWHNYSFDKHVLANHGINAQGFYADTMHLARLYDSARSVVQGGYSLEGLTGDNDIMSGHWDMISEEESGGKRSMKQLFGKANIKKNGEEGKLRVVPPVEELQMQPESREKWIQYSSFDTVCTWCLWKSLKDKLTEKDWMIEGKFKQEGKSMYHFYVEYLQPFGNLLVQMEAEGMMLDREHLARIEEIAVKQQEFSANEFRRWAAERCPDAIYMNVGSDAQIRQLLFGGKENRNESKTRLEMERVFHAPNTEEYVEDGRKTPKKTRPFTLTGLGVDIPVDSYTSGGWPAVGGAALKALAGKVSIDYTMLDEMSAGEDPSMVEDTAVVTSTGVKGGSEEDLSVYGKAYEAFGGGRSGKEACMAFAALCEVSSINTLISNFIQPLQGSDIKGPDGRVHCSLNINTETGRLSARRPSLQNQPALEKDRYKIRQAFVAAPGNSLIVADYGQLELRILAHLTDCKSMLKAFVDGGDFHSRTAMNMYPHVRSAVEKGDVLLEWAPKPGELKPPVPLLKDVFAAERRKAKMLNFSIAYGKTAVGLSKDWKVSPAEANSTVNLWYSDRQEVRHWQEQRKREAHDTHHVHTLLGRTRHFPDVKSKSKLVQSHIERAAINTPVQGSAADVAMCAMLEISRNKILQDLGWKLLLQVHDEVILEGPTKSADTAKDLVVHCMSYPFNGKNNLKVALAVDAKSAQSWYAAK